MNAGNRRCISASVAGEDVQIVVAFNVPIKCAEVTAGCSSRRQCYYTTRVEKRLSMLLAVAATIAIPCHRVLIPSPIHDRILRRYKTSRLCLCHETER